MDTDTSSPPQSDALEPPECHIFLRNGNEYVVPVLNPLAIRPSNAVEPRFELLPVDRSGREFSYLSLNVTEDCNLACKYCFEDGRVARRAGQMSLEVARRGVDMLFRSPSRHLRILFFGGEPLLAWGVIEDVVSYAEHLASSTGKIVSFNTFTNAVLLRERHVEFFKQHGFTVYVSLDGPEEIHNANRSFRNGRGSYFQTALNAQMLLRALPFRVLARTIIDPRQTHLPLRDIVDSLTQLGFFFISFEIPFVKPGSVYALNADLTQHWKGEFTMLAERFLDDALRGEGKWFDQHQFGGAIRRLLQLEDGAPLRTCSSECRAAGAEIVAMSTDGKLYPCYSFVGIEPFVIGHITGGGISNTGLHEQFIRYTSDAVPVCKTCWARFICGNARCPLHSYLYTGNVWQLNTHRCELEKHVIELGLYIYYSLKRHRPEMLDRFRRLQADLRPHPSTRLPAIVS